MIHLIHRRGDLNNKVDMELTNVIVDSEQIQGFKISKRMHEIFLIKSLPETKENLKKYKDMLGYNNGTKDLKGNDYKSIIGGEFDTIAPKARFLYKPTLEEKAVLYKKGGTSATGVEIKSKFTEDKDVTYELKDTDLLASIKDVNAWVGGDITVGSGGTYATWAACVSDVGTFTSNGTATQISDITETSNAYFANDAGGYSMIFDGGGYVVTYNAASLWLRNNASNANIKEIKNFDINNTSTDSTGQIYIHGGDANLIKIHDNRVHVGATHTGYGSIDVRTVTDVLYLYNNLVIKDGHYAGYAIKLADIDATSIIENNTVYEGSRGIECNSLAITLTNNAVFNVINDCYYNTGSLSTFSKCASSDATGSETALKNLVATTVFQDLIDFIPVKDEALNGTGIAPTISGHDTYYNGVTIKTGDVDVGANGLSRFSRSGGYSAWNEFLIYGKK